MKSTLRSTLKTYRSHLTKWARQHKRGLLRAAGAIAVLLLVVQLLYPGDRLTLFAWIDGEHFGGQVKRDAVKQLDDAYDKERLNLSLGKYRTNYDTPLLADTGIKVSNEQRIEDASYPWYMRIVPTSLIWFGLLQDEKPPAYSFDENKAKSYLTGTVGEDCVIEPKDASLRLSEDQLSVVSAEAGGKCEFSQALSALKDSRPQINSDSEVVLPVSVVAPAVGDDDAKKLADLLNRTSQNVELKVADKVQKIEQAEVLSWLTFKTNDNELSYEFDTDKANAYLSKTATPVVAKPAGVTKVSTSDFTETSRQNGATGQTLDLTGTLAEIRSVLDDRANQAKAQVTSLAPKVEYTRTYSKTSTGIAAQLKFYDEDNAGVFGVSFVELGGQGLSAQHNGDRQFVTASTYKLFVAFSTIKRVEADKMKWDDADIAGGRDLAKCFDDMIVKSDNPCAEALIRKIGAKGLNEDIKSIGLVATAFRADNNVTTANDLVRYLSQLEKGSLPIKPENRDRLLGAMKRNVYRQGVPAGASGAVADKVGFLWGLLHDATIVYSPKGVYVLVVLTDGSSWANIADLTRKIEALR